MTDHPMDLTDRERETPNKRPRRTEPDRHRQRRELGVMRRSSDHQTAVFVGSGSGIHFVQSVYSAAANSRTDSEALSQQPENDAVPGEDDQLADAAASSGSKGLWEPGEVGDVSQEDNSITFDGLLTWSQSYWDYWHAAFPFVHAPTVLDWFNDIANRGLYQIEQQLDNLKLAIVRAIFSISLADSRQMSDSIDSRPIPPLLVFDSFDAAVGSVQTALINPPSVLALQQAMAVQLFLVSMLRHNAASRVGGLIVRMIYHMGLHRCPVRYSTFSTEEIALRKRVLWSAYCIDRHISQALGLPLGIRDDDIDVCFLDKETHLLDSKTAADMDDRLAFLNFVSKLFNLKGLILELCNKSIEYRKAGTDTATIITSKITKLSNEIEDFLDTSSRVTSPLSELQLTILKVLQQECTISLNRPLLTMNKASSEYKAALQVCISASRSIITTLVKQLHPTNNSTLSQEVPLLWPSFTWAAWMSAFIILYATIEGEMPEHVAIRLAEQSIEVLKHLACRGSVWPNACAAAIRGLCGRLNHNARPGSRTTTLSSNNVQTEMRADRSRDIRPDSSPTRMLKPNPVHGLHSRSSLPSTSPNRSHSYTQLAFSSAPEQSAQSASRTQFSDVSNPIGTDSSGQLSTHGSGNASQAILNQHSGSDHQINEDPFASFLPWPSPEKPIGGDVNLFEGFDIPFWMGQDEISAAWMPGWS